MLKAFKKTLEEGAFTFVIGMVNCYSSKKLPFLSLKCTSNSIFNLSYELFLLYETSSVCLTSCDINLFAFLHIYFLEYFRQT